MPRKARPKQSLSTYRAKRNFATTPEPSGNAARRKPAAKRARFCVQKHLASHLHYDFRLEHNGVLLSWAVPKGPSLNPGDKRLAVRVEDHPVDYGDFEGVIPEGYGAGIVLLWDQGTWSSESGDVNDAIESGEIKFSLDGYKLKGSWALVQTGSSYGGGRAWLLIKHRDEWSGEVDVVSEFPRSVKSDKDFAEILAADEPATWKSNRPAKGGVAGAMFEKIIKEAAILKSRRHTPRTSKPSKKPPKKSARRSAVRKR